MHGARAETSVSDPGRPGHPARTRRESGVILVTGATGRVGYRLMEALADAGADATAMVRVEAKAADLPGAPRYVVASFDDPPPAETLRGFDRIFRAPRGARSYRPRSGHGQEEVSVGPMAHLDP